MKRPWWWLSFADETAEKGNQFLGAVIVRGDDIVDAVKNAHMFGINPGGQVMGKDIPDDLVVPDWAKHKLLTKEQCEEVDEDFMLQLTRRAVTKEDAVECPVCHNGNVIFIDGRLKCDGECGHVYERENYEGR